MTRLPSTDSTANDVDEAAQDDLHLDAPEPVDDECILCGDDQVVVGGIDCPECVAGVVVEE